MTSDSAAGHRAAIRRGTPDDATALAALRWQSRSDEERHLESLAAFEGRFVAWLRDALARGTWRVAVAQEEARLVGCMYLRRVDTVPVPGIADRCWGYVTHAFVAEPHRDRGIGRDLLDLVLREATAQGLQELHVWPSQGAISLYVRAGFRTPEAQRAAAPPDEPSYVLPLGDKLR